VKASLVVHAAASAPAPMPTPAHPDEIHVWFQSATRKAFVLCAQGWVAWVRGVAIKDVCASAA